VLLLRLTRISYLHSLPLTDTRQPVKHTRLQVGVAPKGAYYSLSQTDIHLPVKHTRLQVPLRGGCHPVDVDPVVTGQHRPHDAQQRICDCHVQQLVGHWRTVCGP
jgi:hypothetical protein